MNIWIFIVIAILCLAALLYFCRPILKKIKFPKIKFKKREKKENKKLKINAEPEEKQKIDTDVTIEENNLDYDGFFKTDFSAKDENYGLSETINDSYDDIFEDLFLDVKPKRNENTFSEIQDSELKDSELKDYFSEDYVSYDEKDISKIIQDLPPEVKAMVFANLLDKKEDK